MVRVYCIRTLILMRPSQNQQGILQSMEANCYPLMVWLLILFPVLLLDCCDILWSGNLKIQRNKAFPDDCWLLSTMWVPWHRACQNWRTPWCSGRLLDKQLDGLSHLWTAAASGHCSWIQLFLHGPPDIATRCLSKLAAVSGWCWYRRNFLSQQFRWSWKDTPLFAVQILWMLKAFLAEWHGILEKCTHTHMGIHMHIHASIHVSICVYKWINIYNIQYTMWHCTSLHAYLHRCIELIEHPSVSN